MCPLDIIHRVTEHLASVSAVRLAPPMLRGSAVITMGIGSCGVCENCQ